MFELEVDHKHIDDERSEAEIISHFHFGGKNIQGVALLPWEEHCTECAMPQCYATCDLYEARKDGKCRRFVHGITPVRGVDNVQGYVVKLAFKQWGQLLAYANVNMVPLNRARTIERGFRFFDEFISRIPDGRLSVKGRRGLSSRLARRLKQSISANGYFKGRDVGDPDYFLVEVYNPNDFQIDLSLSINNTGDRQSAMPFQRLLKLAHGYNEFKIDFGRIARLVDVSNKFGISFNPNIISREEEGLCLYFGSLTFVWDFEYKSKSGAENYAANSKAPHIKVVAWDLDNTLWDGVLIEDGEDNLRIKPGIVEIIQQLDKRGILNTIVSKNNHDDALSQLEKIGIDKYFLQPKIGWGQKGVYIRELVDEFNVGADTFAFIDDSPFERDEVRSLNPDVRVYDAVEFETLLDRPEFSPIVTTESHLRRQYYMYDESRKEAINEFQGDYFEFLRKCDIKINIYHPDVANLDRINELVQRTNQLNFSGNRYSRERIEELLHDPNHELFVVDCNDKYGMYGTVGFALVDLRQCALLDLMLSCRVQSKRVEHALFGFLLHHYKHQGQKIFTAFYKMTDRNSKAGAVFKDLNFVEQEGPDQKKRYTYNLDDDIPLDGVITILWEGESCYF